MVSGGQIKTGAWDPEEDDLLYYWQSKVGNKWSEVAKHIPGRTGQQCAQRWRHKVNPNIRRDKWTPEEDAKLIELVKTFGVGRWAEIARNCDGRTDQQCMGRWRRHLDPSIRRDSWSPEEDAKLRHLHSQYGTSWSRISKNLKGRTSQQCRARWHQINNTRSKGGGGGPGPAVAAAASAGGGRQAGGRKAATTKRKTSRRRHDSSCSEDEDEEEEDFYGDEDEEELEEGADEHGGSSRGNSGGQQYHQEQQEQHDYAAAVAAAAAAAGYGYGAELQQPWVASLAAGMIHGALASGADPAAHAAQQQQDTQQQDSDEDDGCDAEADIGDDDDDDDADSEGGDGCTRAATEPSPSLNRYKSLPSKLGGPGARSGAAAAAAAGRSGLEPSGSLPHSRRAPSSSCMSPSILWPAGGQQQSLTGATTWSPSRLLLSPQQQRLEPGARAGRGMAGAAAAALDVSKDMNEEEAAGAETLLEMATLLQQESCELQPPLLQRSSEPLPLPAHTPPKRPSGSSLDDDLPRGLSLSPYKRARSSRGPLFADEHEECQGDSQRRALRQPHRAQAGQSCADGLLEEDEPGPQQSPAAAAAAGHHRRGASFRHYRVPHAKAAAAAAADEAGDEVEQVDPAAVAAGDGGSFLGSMGFGRAAGGGLRADHQVDAAGRPSNASSLTGFRGQDAMAAAAAAVAAAVFMSPPPAVRGNRLGPPGSATTTPSRPSAQQNVMGLLGSPMFERMVGCATPPSAGRTQPSAATLAALQSPQPSRVPEPFWTPFTGLFQDALFSRGTSATPDLPSAGKPRLPRGLFSPAGQRNGSTSGGKAVARRGLLRGGDVPSPLGASALDTDDEKLCSQPSGGSADRPPAAAAAWDGETGPSPAAACGVHPQVSTGTHRVVRRLDQHEAWATSGGSPNKQHGRVADGSSKRDGLLVASGTSFSLFSPVKKQRVPRFNETSTIKVGPTPSKQGVPDADQLLPIAPLKHNLPEPGSSLEVCSNILQQQQQQQQESPRERLAAAAPNSSLHGRSPLGVKPRDRALQAAAAAAAPTKQQGKQQQTAVSEQQADQLLPEGSAFRSGAEAQPDLDPEQQEASEGAGQQQGHAHSAGAGAGEGQEGLALERAGSINHRPMPYGDPDTPVNATLDTADNTSCSGTPNTPAGVRADADAGRNQGSPSEYVTPPQHRLRASRPLAPLHKDCLIAAATRSLADGLAAQQQRQQQQQQATPGSTAKSSSAATAAAAAGDSPAQCSGDSNKVVSGERVMDSPLEATVLTRSPSQWHQGMVAMLRSLQQTPLQPKGGDGAQGHAAAAAAAEGGGGAAAAAAPTPAGSGCEVVNIKVCSRALRRLQDELERGTAATAAATAAIMARQQQQQQPGQHVAVKQEQQQMGTLKDHDAQVPFSAGLSLAPGSLPAPAAAGASCSTPMMLPLFTSPAAAAPASSRLPALATFGTTAGTSTTPLALAPQCSSGVASVSLTPAVVMLHTPAASAAASAATPRMPAVAWPVQQRSDGGLVVSAPMTAGAAAAATTAAAAAAATGALVQLTPAASSTTKPGAAAGATPFALAPVAATPAAGGSAAPPAVTQPWPQVAPLSVVSIQPLTLLATACNAAVAAGQAVALQSVLALQPAGACGSAAAPGAANAAVPEQLRAAGLPAAGTTGNRTRDSSHTVRSRLHALIDSV